MLVLKAVVLQAFVALAALRSAASLPHADAGGSVGRDSPLAQAQQTPEATALPQAQTTGIGALVRNTIAALAVGGGTVILAAEAASRGVDSRRRQRTAPARRATAVFGRETLSAAQLLMLDQDNQVHPVTDDDRLAFARAKHRLEEVERSVEGYMRCFTDALVNMGRRGRLSSDVRL
jgi:hypothetical protein